MYQMQTCAPVGSMANTLVSYQCSPGLIPGIKVPPGILCSHSKTTGMPQFVSVRDP